MKIERTSRAVVTVRFDDVAAGWEQWILLRSDAHHDSRWCNRKLEKRHLDEMVARDGAWADFGDLFDAMQGRYDPRKSYEDIRSEDVGDDYYDLIVDHAEDFYAPYADRCLVLGEGNHETKTLKHASTDLTKRLSGRLKVERGYYGGWLRFLFTVHGTKRTQVKLKYFHGGGGTAPVSKGVLQATRQAAFLPDAHIVVNGHNHQEYIIVIQRERMTTQGIHYQDRQLHGRIPGYKDEYGDGTKGHAVEKVSGPTPQGAIWLHFRHEGDKVAYNLIMTD